MSGTLAIARENRLVRVDVERRSVLLHVFAEHAGETHDRLHIFRRGELVGEHLCVGRQAETTRHRFEIAVPELVLRVTHEIGSAEGFGISEKAVQRYMIGELSVECRVPCRCGPGTGAERWTEF